jgi:hypothetical protein
VLQVVLGGFGMLIFGHRHLVEPAHDPSVVNMADSPTAAPSRISRSPSAS